MPSRWAHHPPTQQIFMARWWPGVLQVGCAVRDSKLPAEQRAFSLKKILAENEQEVGLEFGFPQPNM
jgi:hypothetical protein